MNTIKVQCPNCGAFSTVRYPDNSYVCLDCRQISHPYDELPDYHANVSRLSDIAPLRVVSTN
jgi:hypothetical protein